MQACGLLQSQRFVVYWVDHSTGVLLVLVCSSIVALSYNVIHSLMIQKTSAVTTTVLGEVKIVGLLLLSALLLGQPNTLYMLLTSSCPVSAQAALSGLGEECMPVKDVLCYHANVPLGSGCSGEKKAFTGKMTVGVTLAMIGFCMYSHTKLKLRPQPARTEDAASSTKQAHNIEEGAALLAEQEPQPNTPTSASLVHRS